MEDADLLLTPPTREEETRLQSDQKPHPKNSFASVFKCCISSTSRQQRHHQQIGRHTTGHGIRPDLSVPRHPFARSPVGPPQHQLYDVKTLGKLAIYHRPYRV